MGWPKEVCMNNDFEENQGDLARNSRARSIARSLIVDFKGNKIGTSRNPFINFLLEFRKVTPSLRMNGAQLAKIGGEMWREMNDKQKSQFQIVETRRRRKGKKRRRRRRGRRDSETPAPGSDS